MAEWTAQRGGVAVMKAAVASLRIMSDRGSPAGQREAIDFVTRRVRDASKNGAKEAMEAGASGVLVRMMHAADFGSERAVACSAALYSIAALGDDAVRDGLQEAGAVTETLRHLRAGSTDCVWTLTALTAGRGAHRHSALVEAGAVSELASVLRKGEPGAGMVQQAARAMGNLAAGSDEGRAAVVHAGAVFDLVRMTELEDEESGPTAFTMEALESLGKVSEGPSEDGALAAYSAGALPALLKLLEPSARGVVEVEGPDARSAAARVLCIMGRVASIREAMKFMYRTLERLVEARSMMINSDKDIVDQIDYFLSTCGLPGVPTPPGKAAARRQIPRPSSDEGMCPSKIRI